MEYNVLVLLVKNPSLVGDKLQNLLTLYGCVVRHRLGLNRDNVEGGIIILDLTGDENQIKLFIREISEIDGIDYKQTKL
jgi:hypothetical protein